MERGIERRRRGRRLGVALALVVLLAGFAACGPGGRQTSATPTGTPVQVSVSVDPRAATRSIPPDFEGFAVEAGNVCALVHLFQTDPAFARLLENLGPGTIRMGGNTLEGVVWTPDGASSCSTAHTVFTRALLDQLFGYVRSVGWRVTWGLTLKRFDPAMYAAEGAYALASGGPTILSLEFGNEPDLYDISLNTYLAEWQAYDATLRAQGAAAPLSGPGTAGSAWIPDFLNTEAGSIAFASRHFYIECANARPTIADLLSPAAISAQVAAFDGVAAVARARGVPYVVSEANNYCQGGMPGVSDVFASALWGVDFLFTALEQGAARVNIQGVPNDAGGNSPPHLNYYAPIDADGSVAPLYYAMLLFHQAAASGRVVPVHLAVPSAINVSAHAVLGADGRLRLVLIDKDLARVAHVTITTPTTYHSVQMLWLQAPSLRAKTGVTLGGSQVTAGGSWSPAHLQTVPVAGAVSSIVLPAGSAVVVMYQ